MTFIKELDNYLKSNLSQKRYNHSKEVANMSRIIADRLGVDYYKPYLSGLAHDIAREFAVDMLKDNVYNWGAFSEGFYNLPNLYHGPVGALLLKEKFKVNDRDVLEAVAYHSIGHPKMGIVAKIVYVADYISNDRVHIQNTFRNKVLNMPLNAMVCAVIEKTISYLNNIGLDVLDETKGVYTILRKDLK